MKLRILAAAYESALGYDRCPDEEECAAYSKEVITHFTEEEFRQGGMICHGLTPSQIADEIIEEIAELQSAQELLKTYNRWRRGEDVTVIKGQYCFNDEHIKFQYESTL